MAARDWSLTAWGEDGPVEVVYPGKTTDHMPQHNDGDRIHPVVEEIVPKDW